MHNAHCLSVNNKIKLLTECKSCQLRTKNESQSSLEDLLCREVKCAIYCSFLSDCHNLSINDGITTCHKVAHWYLGIYA